MNTHKKVAAVMVAALTLATGALGASTATATEEGPIDDARCTPIYETQPNPDYVAEYTIEHPAVTVDHEAEYKVEGKYKKWVVTQEAVPGVDEEFYLKHEYKKQTKTVKTKGKKTELVADWSWWSPASYQWSTTETEVLESGPHGAWKENGWDYVRTYRYSPTGNTEKVVTQEEIPGIPEVGEWEYAWGEVGTFSREWIDTGDRRDVLVKDAWTEVITEAWTETVPAQGDETVEVIVGYDCQPEPLTGEELFATYICSDPADGTGITTTTTTPWTQDYVKVNGEWVLGDKVYGEAIVTTEVQADEFCDPEITDPEPTPPAEPEPTPDPTDTPTTDRQVQYPSPTSARAATPVVAEVTYAG